MAIGTFTRSSSFRVGVILTTLAAAATIFIIYFWRLASSDIFDREARAAISSETFAFEQLYRHGSRAAVTRAIAERLANPQYRGLLALSTQDGQILAGNLTRIPDINGKTHTLLRRELPLHTITTAPFNKNINHPQDVLLTHIYLDDLHMLVGRNIDEIYSAQWFGKTFSWVFVGFLCLTGVLSFAVAFYVVKRINRMSETADSIIRTGSLKERLEIDSSWDDLSQLAVVFNRMLDKIEQGVDNIKAVTDNIAHDLRTPLSRLRSTLEQIADPDLRHKATSEADNLLNMFNSLLRISDLETRRHREGFTTVSLNKLLEDVIDMYQPLAEEKDIALSSRVTSQTMVADPNLLFQAIANVMDNAVKYGRSGGRIDVQLFSTKSRVVLSVNDNGPGVSDKDAGELERRFYRTQSSRTTPGNGLGLSLVSAIVSLHKGALWFVYDPLNEGHGLGVTFTFPVDL
ncbi:sensor histidine kinase [Alteromonas halophila]|uniref:histidine kinase n=1 Tax=Alteromonas halophila TaxID=516698 RepID=A0A918JQA2_9ALTE|nr:HAMP domain-containing sensor histidine kinase [Alteromonas halophila]GGW96997.1 two-component sensor histidine kinase [Alteromonas halophila]